MPHACIVNVGLFRTGTTTLATAATHAGWSCYRWFPNLSTEDFKRFLGEPELIVVRWASSGGLTELVELGLEYDLICDGWCALLPFLPLPDLDRLKQMALKRGISLTFVATTRSIEEIVKSELHHWVIHNLEQRADLTDEERMLLCHDLRRRATIHHDIILKLCGLGVVRCFPLLDIYTNWAKGLSEVTNLTEGTWQQCLTQAGTQNATLRLPIEGVLLTLRVGTGVNASSRTAAVSKLLDQLEQDSLCRYMVVLAVDEDERSTQEVTSFIEVIESRLAKSAGFTKFRVIGSPARDLVRPFPICLVWNDMAIEAWKNGADWVVLLGDDVDVHCSYHYRALYRQFLTISETLGTPLGFGCPWFNDITFPGFPSFPCVGKCHFEIFGALIPHGRDFVNQDLDPYLHRLYSKFMAAPCVVEARLSNNTGGEMASGAARYKRVPQYAWRDFAAEDTTVVREYLPEGCKEAVLVDVVVPSYRVRLDYLQSICSLAVPEYMQTLFIVIVDNPKELERVAKTIHHGPMSQEKSERVLEQYLSQSGNTVRVRCNKQNLGASGSRNRGLDESAAEFVLNLDDDLIPNPDLLQQYGARLLTIDDSVAGLIGLVRFPRSPKLPLRHAAVLMSYLVFMFEVAEQNLYPNPAWGVTANILFRRNRVRFDLAYAKSKWLSSFCQPSSENTQTNSLSWRR